MLRKALKVFAVLAALFVVALGIFIAVFDFDEVVNEQKDTYLPEIEKALGRKVEIGAIKTTLLPVLGAEIRDIRIAGAGDGASPLQIKAVRFGVGLWGAIKSAGTQVELRELVIDGLVVDVTRRADGSLSIDDVLKRLSEGPPPEETPEPLSADARAFIQNLKLDRVALQNASLRFRDEATGGEPALIEVGDLLIEINDAALISPIDVTLTAAVFGKAQNLRITTRVGPLPIGTGGPLPIERIAVELDGLDLAPIVPYLGEALPVGLTAAQISGSLALTDPLNVDAGRALTTDLKVAGLTFEGGQPFTLALGGKVRTPRLSGRIEVEDLAVQIDAMRVTLAGALTGLTTGRMNIEGVRLTSEGLHFGELMARLPPLKAALPPGAVLDGPFTLNAQLDGDGDEHRAVVGIDLKPTRLLIPGAIDKPVGVPMALQVDVLEAKQVLTIKTGDLTIGSLALTTRGRIEDLRGTPTVDITAGTGPFSIDGLVRLLPAVRAAVPPDVGIAGRAEIALKAKGNASAFAGDLKVQITGADLRAPGATLVGSGAITARAQTTGAGLDASLNADLTGLAVRAGDAVDKAAGVPCTAQVTLARAGERLRFGQLQVVFGPVVLTGSGDMAQDGRNANLTLGLKDFKLADLARVLPSAIEGPMAAAQVGLDATIKGDLPAPDSLAINLTSLRFKHGASSLSGTASVKGGPAPVIRFDLNAPRLDVDALAPPGPETAEADTGPVVIPDIVRDIDARGRLYIGQGSARGYTFTDFDGRLTLQKGRLSFEKMDFKAFDGTFSAARTVADLRPTPPKLKLRVDLSQVDAAKLLSQLAGTGQALSGRVTTKVEADATGLDWPTISKSLSGALSLQLQNGRLKGANLETALFDPIQRRLPFLAGKRAPDLGLDRVAGAFEVNNGKMHLKEPMTLMTPQGPLTLRGNIGLDQSLDLIGVVQVSPEVVRRISGNRIKIARAIPVGLKLVGSLTDPKFSGVETDGLATALLAAVAGGEVMAAKAEAERLANEAKARAQAEADKLKARAQAEADKAKARAKAEADKAKARAKAEADKAKKKAAGKAKKAIKGLF